MTIRQLRPGEVLPGAEPRRYRSDRGYIRLRWRVGRGQYVETYEHRADWQAGIVTVAPEIHHKNEQKDDNSRTNLAAMTTAEHGRAHRRVDWGQVAAEYQVGDSVLRVAERHGINSGTVSRILAAEGVPARRKIDYAEHREIAEVLAAATGARSAREIGERLGTSRPVTARLMREAGVAAFRTGRPRRDVG